MANGTSRRWLGWGAGALVVVLAGGGYAYTRSGQNTPNPAHHKAAATKAGAASANGVIVDGLFEEPNLLNPTEGPTMTYSDMVNNSIYANLYETLPNGTIKPLIATGMPTVTNGGKTETFTLRHTKWSDGTPFTAKDVYTTWKVVMSKGYVPWSTVGWTDVKNIKILSPYKFQVILDKPFQPLVADIFATVAPGIIPAEVFGNLRGKAAANAPFNHKPTVTNGPFMFQNWIPGTSITVVPNPNWFGPKPKAKKIVFEVVPDQNALLADVKSHAINVYYFDSVTQVAQLQAVKGATVHFTTQPAWEGIELNLRNPFLQNVKVRQALQMAINTPALVKDVWKGHAVTIAADQPPDSWAHNPSLKLYPFNPVQAKKILLSQGFTMGSNGYLQKGGKTFSLVYSTTSGNPWRSLDQRLIQFWFKQIGVQVTIKNYPANAYFGSVLPSGKGWDMGEFEFAEGLDPQAGMQPMYATGGVNNYGNFSNAALDALFNRATAEVTQASRQTTLRQAETIIHQQLPELFLYSPKEIDTSVNMTGYTPNPFMIDTWNCWNWAPTGA